MLKGKIGRKQHVIKDNYVNSSQPSKLAIQVMHVIIFNKFSYPEDYFFI
jgi:hypothetical protein